MSWIQGASQSFYSTVTSWAHTKYHGLLNQGATCYLNSVLQVLFMTEDFREAVKRYTDENPDTQLIDHHLNALFSDLRTSTAYTYNITRTLGIDKVYEQRDAAEYFERILRMTSEDASQIFHGLLSQKTTCRKCHADIDRDEAFWHLPLALVDSCSDCYSVVDGVKEFFKVSVFCGEDQMYCDPCDAKVDADTQYVMKHHPEVLILLLKRFDFSYRHMSYVKINCDVDVPSVIQIPERQTYELYAFVDHYGDLRSGHYSATIKDEGEDRWYKFNDTSVTLCHDQPFQSDDTMRSHTAYLLFYRKKKDADTQDNMSTNGGVSLVLTENHYQCEDAEKFKKQVEGEVDVEMGDDKAVTASADENETTANEDTVRDVSRGAGLSGEPDNEVNVWQTVPDKNQQNEERNDDYHQDDEEGMRGKAEDQEQNARLLSVETKHEESVKFNESAGADTHRERMLAANFKPEFSVGPEICDHSNRLHEASDAQSRIMDAKAHKDETTEGKQSEKHPMEDSDREAELHEGGLDRQNRNKDQDSNLKTGQQFDPGHAHKEVEEEMKTDFKGNTERTAANELPSVKGKLLTKYDLLTMTKDQQSREDDVQKKMPQSDPVYRPGSRSRLDRKHEQQRKEERRDVKGNRKEKKYERQEAVENPDNGNLADAQRNKGKNPFVHLIDKEKKEDVEIIRYSLKKDRKCSSRDERIDDFTKSKPFDNQECRRESIDTLGRHFEDKKDSKRDEEHDRRRESTRKCSESVKSKDSGGLDERIGQKKKQAKEKEEKTAHFHTREHSGLIENQERGSEQQVNVHNKGGCNQPEGSVEVRGPAKTRKRTRSSILSCIKKGETKAEETSNCSQHDQNTDSLTKNVSNLKLAELAVPETKKRKTLGCFSLFSRSVKSPEQSGEED
ncbi:eukaryotic translation initiation factor 5B-like isoform X2 [Stegastes partitus]|uniref:Ubiquitin carboxyl-terminal hydrolase n=1 Tax=Stegastes partitus TaxID=144197 RepID=A0A9Y4JS92_9TELE|nr:PREDICTED: eukaryotic translation initiation factor 5B-like isoform X2 [Stegastes partitus]